MALDEFNPTNGRRSSIPHDQLSHHSHNSQPGDRSRLAVASVAMMSPCLSHRSVRPGSLAADLPTSPRPHAQPFPTPTEQRSATAAHGIKQSLGGNPEALLPATAATARRGAATSTAEASAPSIVYVVIAIAIATTIGMVSAGSIAVCSASATITTTIATAIAIDDVR